MTVCLAAGESATDLAMPTAPSAPDEVPVCNASDDSSLLVLRRCLGKLEHYRRYVLEDYNDAVKQYVKSVIDLDRRLEIERGAGRIKAPAYAKLHGQIKAALASAGSKGSLMKAYFERLDSLQEEQSLLNDTIKAKERQTLRR
jgi:hypothetical protein